MKAVLFQEPKVPFDVVELDLPVLGPGLIRVKTGASGVCHSDINLQQGIYFPSGPIVVGHEGAGTVIEVGPGVSLVEPGDRVIVVFTAACGTCWQCARQRTHLCEQSATLRSKAAGRMHGRDVPPMGGLGTMAEFMTVHESQAIAVETSLPDEQLALIGCGVTTGVGASLFAANVQPGSTVAVIGCGGVGMSAIQGARAAGASMIIAVDPVRSKRELAGAFGSTHGIDPTEPDALDQLRVLTAGRGVEYALEVVGRPEAMRFAYDATCRGGTTVFVGALDSSIALSLPANDIHASSKRIVGTSYGNSQVRRDVPRLVAMAEAGTLNLELMISERFKLEEVNKAMSLMAGGEVVRSVLICQ
jgi:S-(hydroxymethyl)glutathione dehydrogenase/alcohol dehydrogenase